MSDFFGTGEDRKKVDPEILAHMERYGVVNKDGRRKKERPKKHSKRKGRLRYKLDLHGMTSQTAAVSVRGAVERCKRQGIGEILIVHGWGMHSKGSPPVLKQLVRDMLENELCNQISSFRAASFDEGGEGATIVRLF
ncbi:MAG: Smr/MutS family protein [Chitinispirillaceae bacterium]